MVTISIADCGRDVIVVKSNVVLSSEVFSAVSTEPRPICFGGSRLEFIKALDKTPSQKTSFQNPFRMSPLHIEELMDKPSFSVMSMIDMFSMLRTLLIR